MKGKNKDAVSLDTSGSSWTEEIFHNALSNFESLTGQEDSPEFTRHAQLNLQMGVSKIKPTAAESNSHYS